MKDYLNNLPRDLQELIYLAANVASKNNMSAYLVGGFVRDLILGVNNLDLDIVVEGDGIKFAEALADILQAKLIQHRRFGTATLIIGPNLKVDIATARKEFYPQPASLPEVSPGILKDDLNRRDFTINALAISIGMKNFGKLIDIFGGVGDINYKKIHILHDLSFIDDPTRILRAIRFEQRYNFRISPETLKLLKEAVKLKMLERVQPHRLRDELILMLKEERPPKDIKRIQELSGFGFIFPRLYVSKDTYKLLSSIDNQIKWFRNEYPQRRELDAWLVYFMALVDSLRRSDVRAICEKFAFRKGEGKRILTYKKAGDKLIRNFCKAKIKASRIFRLLEPLSYEAILLIKAKSKNRNIKKYIEDFFEVYNGMRLLCGGDDLRRLGIAPGPYYQKIFTKVLNAKLEGKLFSKEEELALIKKLVNKARLGS